jgi:uncharacterized protein
MAFRYDSSDIAKFKRTPEGYLECYANVTKTGVFYYQNADGSTRRELRHPDHVFKQESMETLALKPVTNDHPPLNAAMLDSKTISQYQVGNLGEKVDVNAPFLKAKFVVQKEDVVNAVEEGKRELSLGYKCDLVEESGMYEGERYDFIQTNIRYNHLAIVEAGRAGEDVKINMDRLDAIQITRDHNNKEINTMDKTIHIDSVSYQVPAQVEVHIAKLRADAEAEKKDAESYKKDMEKKQAEMDALKEEMDQLKKDMEEAKKDMEEEKKEDRIDALVNAKLAVVSAFQKALPSEKHDGLSSSEMKTKVIASVYPKLSLDGKSQDYINGLFDSATATLDSKSSNGDKFIPAGQNRTDSQTAREKMIADLKGGK